MAAIAREAGVSKALLYHYFPSKQDFFGAVLAEGAAELVAVVDADAPPAQQQLDAFLGWVEMRGGAYAKLARAVASPEVRDLMDAVRAATAEPILAGLPGPADARAPRRGQRVAVVHGRRDRRLARAPRPRPRGPPRAAAAALEGALGEPL